ncbi:MAG: glycosyltransferase [Coriobacteriales bacterium]|jgi:rhamnosyltransferase|nr:glycosyltransferase [Coriobacteriales bacterium]
MDHELVAIVVLYNRPLAASPSIAALQEQEGLRLLICDNSTMELGNAEAAARSGAQYINMGGNQGLARAYNQAIATLPLPQIEAVCLFDDDTEVPVDYAARARQYLTDRSADIYLPLVYDGRGLLSPCRLQRYRAMRLGDAELTSLGANQAIPAEYVGVNSGMLIRPATLLRCRFDERLLLDYVDFSFQRQARAEGATVAVMPDIILHQDFSATSSSTQAAAERRQRLQSFTRDLRIYCGNSLRGRLAAAAIAWRRRLAAG